jgi:hypothetical protein
MHNMKMNNMKLCLILFLSAISAQAQLAFTPPTLKAADGNPTVLPASTNHINGKPETARITVLPPQSERFAWKSIPTNGGGLAKASIVVGATNVFDSVMVGNPNTVTNVKMKASIERAVLEGGKLAVTGKNVQMIKPDQNGPK